MQTKTYSTMDKSKWGAGPWDNEPDKKQWTDPETGLPCMIVRNRLGAWCGYVGLPPGHPAHGKYYDDINADAHGGLTYADHCEMDAPEESAICHVPDTGEPDHIWWVGFDCCHGCDIVPGMPDEYRLHEEFAKYRTQEYVEREVINLAYQLAVMNGEKDG